DLAVRTRHGARLQARELAFDIEVADFAEIEELLVKPGPLIHIAAKHIVRDVVDVGKTGAIVLETLRTVGRQEVDVVDRMIAIAIDQINYAAADAFDRRNVELHRADLVAERPGAQFEQLAVGKARVL